MNARAGYNRYRTIRGYGCASAVTLLSAEGLPLEPTRTQTSWARVRRGVHEGPRVEDYVTPVRCFRPWAAPYSYRRGKGGAAHCQYVNSSLLAQSLSMNSALFLRNIHSGTMANCRIFVFSSTPRSFKTFGFTAYSRTQLPCKTAGVERLMRCGNWAWKYR